MNCVVSGGTGFIGHRIVDRLQRDGHEVAVWTRRPSNETRVGVRAFAWDPLHGEPRFDALAEKILPARYFAPDKAGK